MIFSNHNASKKKKKQTSCINHLNLSTNHKKEKIVTRMLVTAIYIYILASSLGKLSHMSDFMNLKFYDRVYSYQPVFSV